MTAREYFSMLIGFLFGVSTIVVVMLMPPHHHHHQLVHHSHLIVKPCEHTPAPEWCKI